MSSYWLLSQMIAEPALKDLFVASGGQPIEFHEVRVVQSDQSKIPDKCEIIVSFIGKRIYENNAAVVAIQKPGRIFLSDGSAVNAVAIWDGPDLPRTVHHVVESGGKYLEIYNKYRIFHSKEFVSEDSFTGNAGMVVTEISQNTKRYECSNGTGAFSPLDLIFDVSIV